jgi:hypothetical protein
VTGSGLMAGWLPVRRVREIGAGLRRKYPHVPAPVSGVTVDMQARTAIDEIRQLLINAQLMEEE